MGFQILCGTDLAWRVALAIACHGAPTLQLRRAHSYAQNENLAVVSFFLKYVLSSPPDSGRPRSYVQNKDLASSLLIINETKLMRTGAFPVLSTIEATLAVR